MNTDHGPDIKFLFQPRSVAVVGAATTKEKIGYKVVENIVASQYPGRIYPVNPKGGEIFGLPLYKNLSEIDGDIDLAIIAIPALHTFEAVQACAGKGVKFLIIITSGFSEIGHGAEEKRMAAYAREQGMRILGPNVFGLYSSRAPINATFGPKDTQPGNVAIVTQSGALGIALMGKTRTEKIGLSAVVSVGNKSDLDEADLLEYLIADGSTRVVLLYIEGIKQGQKLVQVLKKATQRMPVVVIKSGRSKRGAVAAASHTGSLAGTDEIFSGAMKQCRALRAESLQEGLDWCKFLSRSPLPQGEDTVIITNGGGIGVLAADAAEKYGVNLSDDLKTMEKVFSKVVPEFGSVKNPIDVTGQATVADYKKALQAAAKNESINSVICLGCETAVFDVEQLPPALEKLFPPAGPEKPMVFSFLGGEKVEAAITLLRSRGIPIFSEVYEAVSCVGALYAHYRHLRTPEERFEEIPIASKDISGVLQNVKVEKRQFLLASEAAAVMRAAAIGMPKSGMARSLEEAVGWAAKIGFPVVMKVVSKDIIHKSDVGGVALDLENTDEVVDAYQAIIHNCRLHQPDAVIAGVEISEMIQSGIEIIVGARRDAAFGPLVMFGLGGIYVEVMKDVSFRAFPLGRTEVLNMISEIKSYPLLLGVRGERKKDINSVADVILRVGTILLRHEEISDLEINPLIVYEEGEGVKALDARILLSKTEVQ